MASIGKTYAKEVVSPVAKRFANKSNDPRHVVKRTQLGLGKTNSTYVDRGQVLARAASPNKHSVSYVIVYITNIANHDLHKD